MEDRVELIVDVFENKGQMAKVLRSLSIRDLIDEILIEFEDDLVYLDRQSPWSYSLRRKDGEKPLALSQTIAEHHLSRGTELVFEELPVPLPPAAAPMPGDVYLVYRRQTDADKNRAFKLNWQPAIIGRPDALMQHNDLLAVDLESFPTGLRVSRRHAQIKESGGRYYLECLTNNPLWINDAQVNLGESQELQDGDQIHLVRSDISLTFVSRSRSEA